MKKDLLIPVKTQSALRALCAWIILLLMIFTGGTVKGKIQTPTTSWSDKATEAVSGRDYTANQGTLEIHTEIGLAWLAKTVNEAQLAATKVLLTADLDLSGHLWTPIGYSGTAPFVDSGGKGVLFDGQNHVIQNMICTGAQDKKGFTSGGLFGWAAYDTLQNIIIKNASVTAIGQNEYGYAGGLVGVAYAEEIINCHVIDSDVTGGRVPAQSTCAGGMAGYSTGGLFTNCTVKATTVNTSNYGGGFVGEIDDEYGERASEFLQCATIGCTILANCNDEQTLTQSGAFIGEVTDSRIKAENCYTYGCEVVKSADSKTRATIGLFTGNLWWDGYSTLTAKNCFADGTITNADVNKGPFGDYVTLTDCYYNKDSISEDEKTGLIGIKTSDFADGKLAYLLNKASSGIWGQIIGTDSCPDFLTENNKVNKITYTGAYTATAYCNGSTVLPKCSEAGYVYTFTIGQKPFLGTNITQDVTVTVGKEVGFSGDGTAENPYLIETEAQLAKIKDDMDAHYKLMNDIEFTTAWECIEKTPSPNSLFFKGVLDGNYHTITFNTDISSNITLFNEIAKEGTVKNLGVIVAKATKIRQNTFCGTIAFTNRGTIENCYSEGAISQLLERSADHPNSAMGGIVAYNTGIVRNCYSSASLENTGSQSSHTGGLVGYNEGTIEHCIALNPTIKTPAKQSSSQPYGNRIAGYSTVKTGSAINYASPVMKFTPSANLNGLEGGILPQSITWSGWKAGEGQFSLKNAEGNAFGTEFQFADYAYLSGSGTEAAPFLIKNKGDFKKMCAYLNNNYMDAGVYYRFDDHIDMSGETFNPIGGGNSYQAPPFAGVLDGNGKIISNLTITPVDNYTRSWDCGLFAKIGYGAQIKNLGLTNCTLVLSESPSSIAIGGIAGKMETKKDETVFPHIDNCFIAGSFNVELVAHVGGMVGKTNTPISGTEDRGTISNSYTDIAIRVKPEGHDVAGISVANLTTVKDCYALGDITTEEIQTKRIWTYGINSGTGNSPTNGCLALMDKISANSSSSGYKPRSIHGSSSEDNKCDNNYMSQKMVLSTNGTEVEPDLKDAQKRDGLLWNGELPSDAWEKTADGYINLKSIRQTFGKNQQIKLVDYVPFAITVDKNLANGTITTDLSEAMYGTIITLTVTPDSGYSLKPATLKVTGADNTAVTVIEDSEDKSKYTFTMPAQAITISAEFELLPLDLSEATGNITIGKEGTTWWYQQEMPVITALRALPSGAIPFNGTIKGITTGMTVKLSATAKGDLKLEGAVSMPALIVENGADVTLKEGTSLTVMSASGTAVDVKAGATLTIGTPSATFTTSSADGYGLANAGTVNLVSGILNTENTSTADNGIKNDTGASIHVQAPATGTAPTLSSSGITNAGSFVADKGTTVEKTGGASGSSELVKTYEITITAPTDGNTLTASANGIALVTGSKMAANTVFTVTATTAANYTLQSVSVKKADGTGLTASSPSQYTMPESAVTLSATFTYTDPTPDPDPDPVYYTLTFPTDSVIESDKAYWSGIGIQVTGMTKLSAGVYKAQSGTVVTLTIDSDPNRTFQNWEDGTKTLPRTFTLREDMEVNAFFHRAYPTGNGSVEVSRLAAYVRGGVLWLESEKEVPVRIFALSGLPVYTSVVSGQQQVSGLASGVYLVHLSNKVFKVIVKR